MKLLGIKWQFSTQGRGKAFVLSYQEVIGIVKLGLSCNCYATEMNAASLGFHELVSE